MKNGVTDEHSNISISLLDLPLILRGENPDTNILPAFNSLVMSLEGRDDFLEKLYYFADYQSKWNEFLQEETPIHPCEDDNLAFLCTFLTSQLQANMLEVHKVC